MANREEYFEDLVKETDGGEVGGISDGLQIKGKGTFCFDLEDDEGKIHKIKIPNSLFLPKLRLCLLSPQHWAQEARDEKPRPRGTRMENDAKNCILIWGQGKFKRTVPFDPTSNTPIFRTASSTASYRAFVASFEALEAPFFRKERIAFSPSHRRLEGAHLPPEEEFVAEENLLQPSEKQKLASDATIDDDTVKMSNVSNKNVTNPNTPRTMGALTFDPSPKLEQDEEFEPVAVDDGAELMRWHYRLGHLSFSKLKNLAKRGEIPTKLAKVKTIKCAGCIYGAMTRVPWRTKEHQTHHVFVATKPGECVSVDQMVSTQVGFVAQLKGKLTSKRYTAATIFVDHFSRLRFIYLMASLSTEETLAAKRAFERYAEEHGVAIKHYHCDNGRFADTGFKEACQQARQELTFCGVNAHFQNGVAERAIRDLQESARKQLLHAKQRWPSAVHLALWPYALRSASVLHNTLPVLDDGTSRLELFSGIRVGVKMRYIHTFACPVFALQNSLASGGRIPKWSPRARLGLNLGPSPSHARNVNLVLNLTTGLVSPQYHVTYDDFFETTRYGAQDTQVASTWQQLAGLVRPTRDPTVENVENFQLVGPPTITPTYTHTFPTETQIQEKQIPSMPVQVVQDDVPFSQDWSDTDSITSTSMESQGTSSTCRTKQPSMPTIREIPTPIPTGTSSRGRQRTMSRAMMESLQQSDFYGHRNMHYMAAQSELQEKDNPQNDDILHDWHLALQDRMRHPIAFHAEMMGDIMYLHQALKQPDASEFVKAVIREVNGHVENKNWQLVERSEVPPDITIVPSVWAMRRKRNLTTNEITKYKARLNLHGGKQEYGVNYFETYAPVVTWFAIRLLIIFAITFNWYLRQIDFIMAYPQAPIEMDMYMELPMGIQTKHGNSKDHVLKLLRNIYGQKQAGRVWNTYLVDKLLSIGFKQSLIDDCVFYRGTLIFIVYVDDGIFLGKSDSEISQAITELSNLGLNIEDQGHPADYVGVTIKKTKEGGYEFTQRALIDAIIKDVGLTDAKTKPVPAKVSLQLHAFKSEPPFSLDFNYRSVVGKLNYLAQTTRADICYATHQIAKYSSDPRVPHGEAILYLVRYLKKTRDMGLKFKPDPAKGFECYCDADFSGNWNQHFAAADPSTSKSRSGWVIFYADCPIIWASKLQSQVALSTTEAEYIAMSMSLRDVIPVMNLVQEMKKNGFKVLCTNPHVYCKVFEDNSGALELARLPKLRPRTKHINVCYHHFREHVRKGLIKIFPIDTDKQIADVFTKALPQNSFIRHRKFLCGM